jgi:uncharacterized spore protein YtfJ
MRGCKRAGDIEGPELEVDMTGEHNSSAVATAADVPSRRSDALIGALLDRIGGRFGASTVFGTPVEREGVTVIPVATARFGFGGGAGTDPDKHQEGEGAGVGGAMTPAGYIELKDGRSRFVPVVHPERMVAMVLAGALAALVVVARRPAGRRLPFVR